MLKAFHLKDGANSMLAKPLEAKRLVSLRRATLIAFQGQPPLCSNIRLAIQAHIGPVNNRSIGDLDTFIAGVCDGLMARNPKSKLDDQWNNPANINIHPDKDRRSTRKDC